MRTTNPGIVLLRAALTAAALCVPAALVFGWLDRPRPGEPGRNGPIAAILFAGLGVLALSAAGLVSLVLLLVDRFGRQRLAGAHRWGCGLALAGAALLWAYAFLGAWLQDGAPALAWTLMVASPLAALAALVLAWRRAPAPPGATEGLPAPLG